MRRRGDRMNAIKKEMSRRNLFRYLGNAAVFLPFMRTLMETQAFGEIANKRAVFFYFPDGIIEESFHPAELGRSFVLPAMTAPLATVQSDIIMVRGVDYKTSGAHEGGAGYCLTGTETGYRSVSLDTYLGERLPGKIPVVRLGVASQYEGSTANKSVSFAAPGIPSQIEDNPSKAFASLFGSGSIPLPPSSSDVVPATSGLSAAFKASVLDDSLEQIKGLQSRLGSLEKEKLDLHIASVREIERRLQAGPSAPVSPQCTGSIAAKKVFDANDSGYPKQYWLADNFDVVADMQTEIALQALACGVTNCVLLQMSHSTSNARFTAGVPSNAGSDHHETSHYASKGPANHIANQAYMMSKLANLIKGMGQLKEGDRSVLYNSMVLGFSEVANSHLHNFKNVGLVVAGQAGGFFQTGRAVDATGYYQNHMLVSVLQAVGLTDQSYGSTSIPLSGMIPSLRG